MKEGRGGSGNRLLVNLEVPWIRLLISEAKCEVNTE
jgi:hypothetical protein